MHPAKLLVRIALCLIVISACVLTIGLATRNPIASLGNEIYQVRGQLVFTKTDTAIDGHQETQSQILVFLRNGVGKDFKIILPVLLPKGTFFVKPGKNDEESWILIPVKNIVEEQKEEKANNKEA